MPRLTKTEIYAIRWLNSQSKNLQEICEELKLLEKQVQAILEKNHGSATKNNNIKNATEKANKKPPVTDLMITNTSNKKINSVAIMTKEASEVSDANKHTNSPSMSKSFKNSIYRPNSNK
jgi:uncharacterized protein YoxC